MVAEDLGIILLGISYTITSFLSKIKKNYLFK